MSNDREVEAVVPSVDPTRVRSSAELLIEILEDFLVGWSDGEAIELLHGRKTTPAEVIEQIQALRAVVSPVDTLPPDWKHDYSFAAEVINAFLKMGVCPYGYDRGDLGGFSERLAARAGGPHGGGSHKFQPDSLNPGYCRRCSEIEAAHGGGGQ